MPVYVYKCDSCGIQFEKLQSFSAPALTDCPQCDGRVHRVIQPVGIIFKGSGFYVTDTRSKSSTMPPTKRESDGGSESGTTDGTAKKTAESTAGSGEAKAAESSA